MRVPVTPTAREIVAAADTSPASQAQKRLDGMVVPSAGRLVQAFVYIWLGAHRVSGECGRRPVLATVGLAAL